MFHEYCLQHFLGGLVHLMKCKEKMHHCLHFNGVDRIHIEYVREKMVSISINKNNLCQHEMQGKRVGAIITEIGKIFKFTISP